jgi:hypothetical protein
MRKLLLFLFFSGITIFGSYGQEIQLFNNENLLIPDNSVIKVYGNPSDDQITSLLWIKNASLQNLSINVSKEIIQQVNESSNSFYWGSYIEQNETSTFSLNLIPDQLSNDFSALYTPNSSKGTSQIKYSFYDKNNPQISTSVILEFITDHSPNTIKNESEMSLSNAYPNPAESIVYFDYTLHSQILEAKIIIRTLLGSIVAESNLEGLQGKASINVEDLIKGIYFYSLVVDSDIKLTKKLIVKH